MSRLLSGALATQGKRSIIGATTTDAILHSHKIKIWREGTMSLWLNRARKHVVHSAYLVSVLGATSLYPPMANAQAGEAAVEEADVDTIVVSAQRRSETLRQVPISVTVIAGKAVEDLNIRNVNNIQTVTPGLIFDTGASFPQAYIRGLGVATPTPGLEAPVALYVDGSYVPRSVGTLFDLVDIDSIQVLKGPQGTLYGRNATGGAILITTADPTSEFDAKGSLEYGRFNRVRGEASVNLPVGETLAFRFAGAYSQQDGFVTNIATGKKIRGFESYLVRGKVKWEPSPEFRAVLGAEYQDIAIDSPAAGRQVAEAPFCVSCLFGVPNAPGFYQVNEDLDVDSPRHSWYTYLNLDYEAGNIAAMSTTTYRHVYTFSASDVDHSSLSLQGVRPYFGGGTFEQDFQISSSFDGPINFLAGGQYISDRAFSRMAIFGDVIGIPKDIPEEQQIYSNGRLQTETFAAFAEIYLKPIDRVTVTVGGRYSTDRRSLTTEESPIAQLFFNPTGSPTFTQSVRYTKFTPRFVLAYDTGDINFYASYTKGFKAGGFNTPAFAIQEAIEPENIDSYEIGAKFVSPDRRTRMNISAFLYNHKDVQVSVINVARGGQVIENAASARGKGVEFDLSHRVNDWLTVSGGAAYLRAEYRSHPNAQAYLIARDGAGIPVGYVSGIEDLSGYRLPRAPKLTLNGGADINIPVNSDWNARLTPTIRYTTGYDFIAGAGGPSRNDRQRALTLVNLSGGVGPNSGKYEIGFYIDNLLNKKYYEQIVTSVFGYETYVAPPITYGARLKFRIGN
ncbi:TonB-dependent receptor [Sphingosinicella microcystinivorans]|uniref:TonB-dependent receptor n=1 Tax=Sphingosinicella microcystinivorans TaxID=335406 RepID=UPI0022F40008|nr:TonB-dependent receptor [Sphingosinicella microcystinivorans]WBX83755.1 TonB-dependent receptor [Sphingosinicella microcystinivorans]